MKRFRILSLFLIAAIGLGIPAPAWSEEAPLSDEQLLDLIQKKGFEYFINETNASTGLTADRANNFTYGATSAPASIAAVGFALTAYGVGVHRGWIEKGAAMELTRRTLKFMLERAPQEHGFFYHFMDMKTGARAINSELSPIDTALFLAGALFAAQYFQDAEIQRLAKEIYERVDWEWMMQGGKTLRMAWSPDTGFTRYRWDHYNESMIMYLLAIGSPTHPIPASSWKEIKRPVGSYGSYRVIYMPPLFTHQFSHIWIDFRDKNDGNADYFKNSVNATLANRLFAIEQAIQYKTYGYDSWGLTASDGPGGYKAYGAPPGWATHDGTVAPTACGSSIVFTPKESIRCLRHFYEKHYDKLWGNYGFSDAFNLDKNWFSQDAYGIDQGPLVLMIENYRSGLIWETMKGNAELKKAMDAVGFKSGTMEVEWPEPPQAQAEYMPDGIQADGFLRDWPNGRGIQIDQFHDKAETSDKKDFKAEIRFAWDKNALYFYLRASDNSFMARTRGKNIWQDDVLEMYLDPQGNGLFWGSTKDFQIGFRPNSGDNSVTTWSWFQSEDPVQSGGVKAAGYVYPDGYIVEGAILWRYLGMRPEAGETIRVSPAFHDIDRDKNERKYEWFFRNEEKAGRFVLGKILLKEPEAPKPAVQNPENKNAAEKTTTKN